MVFLRLLAAGALALSAACDVSANGQIPCADDSSCPADYPVCSAGKCVAAPGGVKGSASVQIVGVPGKAATDPLRGTVNVQVVAKASSGVKSVTLDGGGKSYSPDASSAPPVFAFTVDTTKLTDGSVPFTATVTPGDSTQSAKTSDALALVIDNTPPTLTIGVVGSTEIADGTMVAIDVTSTEPLVSVTGTVSGSTTNLSQIAAPTGNIYHFGYAATAADAAGAHNISVDAADAAGNAASKTLTPAFSVQHPFGFASVAVTTPLTPVSGFAAARTGTVVTVKGFLPNTVVFAGGVTPVFKLTSASGGPTRTLTPTKTAGSPNDTWTAAYAVVAADHDGLATIAFDATDIAANVAATKAATLLIDQTAPAMASIGSSKQFVLTGASLTISGVANERLQSASINLNNGDSGTCMCDGGLCASDLSEAPVVSCAVTVSHGPSGNAPLVVTGTLVLNDRVGNASASAAPNQAQYTVEPLVNVSGGPFAVVYSQNGINKITGGSAVGHLTFTIPTISGGSVTLTDSFGNSYFDSATILAASGSTLNGSLPSTVATDSFVIPYTLTVSNPAAAIGASSSMTVVPAPAVTSFSASASAVTNGATAQLVATFTGGTGMVAGTNGFTSAAITSGTPLTVTPPSDLTTTYTLTVTNAAADSAGTIIFGTTPSVTAVAAPTVGNGFAVTNVGIGASGTSQITGGSTSGTLTFAIPTITGGTSATLTDDSGGGIKDTGGISITSAAILAAAGGTLTGVAMPTTDPTASTTLTYTLAVTTASGSATSKTTALTVVPVPVISAFSAASTTVMNGTNNTTLTAQFTGGTGVVSKDNFATTSAITSNTPLTVTSTSDATTVWKLKVTSPVNDSAASVVFGTTVSVTSIAGPTLTGNTFSVTYTGSASSQMTGGSSTGTLTFSIPTLAPSSGATASITDNFGNAYSTSGAIITASGGSLALITIPGTSSTDSKVFTFTLKLTNAAGSSTSTSSATLTIVPVPVITGFSAASTTVANGTNNTTLTAQFSGGTGVVSKDNFGTTTAITSNTPLTVTSTSDATTVWKLKVTNPVNDSAASIVSSTTVSVTSIGPPSATGQLTVSPHVVGFNPGNGNLTFFAPTFGTTVVSPATITGGGFSANITSGGSVTTIAAPTGTTTYTLTMTNGVGATLTQTATVLVADLVSTPPLSTTQTNCGGVNCIGKFGVTATWVGGTSTRVLLTGGSSTAGCAGTIANGWVYWDTATASVVNSGTFTQVTAGRCGHTATLLSNGKIAIVGGTSSSDTKATHIDLFDPSSTGSISDDKSLLTTARCGHVAALATTASNSVVIAGGTNCNAFPSGTALGSVEIYTPSTTSNQEAGVTAPLNGTRVGATATLLNNGKVLIAGGNASATSTADVFTFNSGTPASSAIVATSNEMQFARSKHTATLLASGKVLLVGGATTQTAADIYDPAVGANGTFSVSVVNSIQARISHGATLLP
ncbi:MAG: beta strand repeat-containing protein, partial [Myxococcales bacterium]